MNELKLQELEDIIKAGINKGIDIEKLADMEAMIKTMNYELVYMIKFMNEYLSSPISIIQYLMCLYGLSLSDAKLLYQEYSDVKLN